MSEDMELEHSGVQSDKTPWLIVAVVCVLVLLVVGVLGQLSGTGWFGYRSLLYGKGELYVLNMHREPRVVIVDGIERVEIPALNAQLVELIGGTSSVVVENTSGKQLAIHTVTVKNSNAVLKLTTHKCMAVVDLTPYYKSAEHKELLVLHKMDQKTHVHVLDSKNTVWPRKPFPKKFNPSLGKAVWVELVGCNLFEDEDFLAGYLELRLRERMNKAQERTLQKVQPTL